MIAEWVLVIIFGSLVAAVGWLISWLFGRLSEAKRVNNEAAQKNFEELKTLVRGMVDKFDTIFSRLTKVESDCLKHKDLEDVVGPMAKKLQELEKNQSVLATSCAMRHSKDK